MTGYQVFEAKHGKYIVGSVPMNEFTAIIQSWDHAGLKHIAVGVSTLLGASIAVTATPEDEELWLAEIRKERGVPDDDWLHSGDTGVSSLTIYAVLSGDRSVLNRSRFGPNIPFDPSDFGRCYRLLERFPEWRDRLHEVADIYPAWRPLVDHWDELTALYEEELPFRSAPKLYALMEELRSSNKYASATPLVLKQRNSAT